jgi:hypothetical protein
MICADNLKKINKQKQHLSDIQDNCCLLLSVPDEGNLKIEQHEPH